MSNSQRGEQEGQNFPLGVGPSTFLTEEASAACKQASQGAGHWDNYLSDLVIQLPFGNLSDRNNLREAKRDTT